MEGRDSFSRPFYIVFFEIIWIVAIYIIIFAHKTPINNRFLLKMKEYTHYNRIKSVLAEKNKTGTWLSE